MLTCSEDGETVLGGHGGGARQTSMRAFVPTRRCDAQRTAKNTRLIYEMTARDMLPLSLVEGNGFEKLMQCCMFGIVMLLHLSFIPKQNS